eukprot:CAMPEP_0174743624 /NCGR_PEP_ID=MMETSP1094-20130205/82109_1 /TAXON_ID=156173 /ORGANISM="Chrysochromulina brevifilum, Strain UTEX LB 985" /LENGTH=57 /DNA_ID=CAMNT_0015947875 /DNA_START=59 /DNA_END=230 /DNA_ORIENTATION=+
MIHRRMHMWMHEEVNDERALRMLPITWPNPPLPAHVTPPDLALTDKTSTAAATAAAT